MSMKRVSLLTRAVVAFAMGAVALVVPLAASDPERAAASTCTASASFAGGDGSSGDPFQIATPADLLYLASDSTLWTGNHFVQTAPIDMVGCPVTPIGDSPWGNREKVEFENGSFDGGGFAIDNVAVSVSASSSYVGLFGYTKDSVLRRLRLDVTVPGGNDTVGGLVGLMEGGIVDDVVMNVSVSGLSGGTVGGLVGEVWAKTPTTVSAVTLSGRVEGNYGFATSGLIAMAYGSASLTVSDAAVSADVDHTRTDTLPAATGGVIGDSGVADTMLTRIVYSGAVSATAETGVGGLIGSSRSGALTLDDVELSSVASVNGLTAVGGIVGEITPMTQTARTDVTMNRVVAGGSVSGGESRLGGAVGALTLGKFSSVTISDVRTSADVTGTGASEQAFGGAVGYVFFREGGGLDVEDVVVTSRVDGGTGSQYVGGLLGQVTGDGATPSALAARRISISPGATVVGTSEVGGLLGGVQYSVVSGSTPGSVTIDVVDSTVEPSVIGLKHLGGVVGYVNGKDPALGLVGLTLRRIGHSGDVSVSAAAGSWGVGGVVGYHEGQDLVIDQVVTSGQVSGVDGVGGVIGEVATTASISGVTRSGDVSASSFAAGGFVGYLDNGVGLSVQSSSSSSDVRGGSNVGGVVGSKGSKLLSLQNVTLTGSYTGSSPVGCYVGAAADEDAVDQLLRPVIATGTKATTSGSPVGCVQYLLPPPPPASASTPSTTAPTTTTPTTSVPSTTTPPNGSAPTPVPTDGGVLPELAPGASQVLEDGVPADVEVFVDNSTDLVLEGNGFELRLAGECSTGCTIDTTPDGRQVLTLERQGLANVQGVGFQPGTPVYVWLFSEPRFLGELVVNADGTFGGTVALGDIEVGEHTLQVNGTSFDGTARTANLGVLVEEPAVSPPGGQLPATGSGAWQQVMLSLFVLSTGALAVLLARRRRLV